MLLNFATNGTYGTKLVFDTLPKRKVTLFVLLGCTPTSALGLRGDQSAVEVKCDMNASIGHRVCSHA
jgi:hypothetical protein